MKVKIRNIYTDGHESEKVIELPEPPADTTVELLGFPSWKGNERLASPHPLADNWWWENVYPHTGDGHGAANPRLGAGYFVEIIEAADPQLVGADWEWC